MTRFVTGFVVAIVVMTVGALIAANEIQSQPAKMYLFDDTTYGYEAPTLQAPDFD